MINTIRFTQCKWEDIRPFVIEYFTSNNAVVDSFWEAHVLESNHYKITNTDGEIVGFFAIHKESTITLFHVLPHYASQSQELFVRSKKYENVANAMVPTSDEFFLSHCLDSFTRIEKQAYFALYTDNGVTQERKKTLELRLADIDADKEILKLSGDFLDHSIEQISNNECGVEIYIAQHDGNIVGFGVVDYGRITKDIASIGMYVCEQYRMQGFAANILEHLKLICFEKSFRVVSGCWYYNHNSKKSMEAAGAYSKTRLVRFYF